MKKKTGIMLLAAAVLVSAFLGLGIGLSVGKSDEEVYDLSAGLTKEEERRFAGYLNLPADSGLEIHLWKQDGKIVGMILPLRQHEETAEELMQIRQKSLPLAILSKIVRRYPDASVSLRSSEGLTDKEREWAKAICFLP